MLMFRFWSSESRGSEKTVDANVHMPLFAKPVQAFLDSAATRGGSLNPGNPLKRRRQSIDDVAAAAPGQGLLPPKRIKIEPFDARAEQNRVASSDVPPPVVASSAQAALERAKDVIQFQMGLEVLYKHEELRLINQELAKCQIALEQLRRCHLIPYPVNCPTPDQMVEISSGKGLAVRSRPGEPVPQWAPPYGVVDGPYARHYAKWLIPDPKFDGNLPPWQGVGPAASSRSAAEGRTTRNSIGEISSLGKPRAGRGASSQKLHSLSAGYPQPKDKAGPCVLKRSDGQTVKLVCIDCHRENFSSTQGFINHCRIAHKRDFKSHEEAAVHCGHPIEVDQAGSGVAGEERANSGASAAPSVPSAPVVATPATGVVHPLSRSTALSEQEAYAALLSRIRAATKLCNEGKWPPATSRKDTQSVFGDAPLAAAAASKAKPRAGPVSGSGFIGTDEAPYLSRLMKIKNCGGDLAQQVADAKTREPTPDIYPLDDDSEDSEQTSSFTGPGSPVNTAASRAPGVMRIPARAAMVPAAFSAGGRPASSKACAPHLAFATPLATPTTELPPHTRSDSGLFDDEMDVDLSPNTMASNNAPSLVSDDGEYDDSDEDDDDDTASTSDASEVTEIKLEDDHEAQDQMTPRALRKASSSSVNMKKDDSRHVTFVSPVRRTGKVRRRKNTLS